MNKEFISCEQNYSCPVTNSLQKTLKWSTITVNVQLSPVVPWIPGPLENVRHSAYCCPSHLSGTPHPSCYITGSKQYSSNGPTWSRQAKDCVIVEATLLVNVGMEHHNNRTLRVMTLYEFVDRMMALSVLWCHLIVAITCKWSTYNHIFIWMFLLCL
jgi:hypothetical protein